VHDLLIHRWHTTGHVMCRHVGYILRSWDYQFGERDWNFRGQLHLDEAQVNSIHRQELMLEVKKLLRIYYTHWLPLTSAATERNFLASQILNDSEKTEPCTNAAALSQRQSRCHGAHHSIATTFISTSDRLKKYSGSLYGHVLVVFEQSPFSHYTGNEKLHSCYNNHPVS